MLSVQKPEYALRQDVMTTLTKVHYFVGESVATSRSIFIRSFSQLFDWSQQANGSKTKRLFKLRQWRNWPP
jgi:hypothetical protein